MRDAAWSPLPGRTWLMPVQMWWLSDPGCGLWMMTLVRCCQGCGDDWMLMTWWGSWQMPSLLLCNYNILTPDSDEVLLRTEQLHQRHLDQYQLKIFPDLDTKNMFIWWTLLEVPLRPISDHWNDFKTRIFLRAHVSHSLIGVVLNSIGNRREKIIFLNYNI